MTLDTIAKASVVIDYGMSLQDMIAANRFDRVNDNINPEHFPIKGTGIVEMEPKVFFFNRHIPSDDAVAAVKADDTQNPWEPAKIEALLAYGAKHPYEQRQYPIVGLGSVAAVDHFRRVPCLSSLGGGNFNQHGTGRTLDLEFWAVDVYGTVRVLAVRKLRSAA